MPNLQEPWPVPGFDESRNLLVTHTGATVTLNLAYGAGLHVAIEDPTVAQVSTDAKLAQADTRPLKIRGGLPGSTLLHATADDGRDLIKPLTIVVTGNVNCCQVNGPDGPKAAIWPEFRRELQALPLRQAVIRVAEDQMNSLIGKQGRGNEQNFYRNVSKSDKWCGAFAYWCWAVACAAQGKPTPFGDSPHTGFDQLASPEKGMNWAARNPGLASIYQFAGATPTFKDRPLRPDQKTIPFKALNADGGLEPGDIVFDGWDHVCMVHTYEGDQLITIDGNQGAPCIKRVPAVSRRTDAIVTGKKDLEKDKQLLATTNFRFRFLHLLNLP